MIGPSDQNIDNLDRFGNSIGSLVYAHYHNFLLAPVLSSHKLATKYKLMCHPTIHSNGAQVILDSFGIQVCFHCHTVIFFVLCHRHNVQLGCKQKGCFRHINNHNLFYSLCSLVCFRCRIARSIVSRRLHSDGIGKVV